MNNSIKKKEKPEDGWPWQYSKNRPFFVYDPEGDGFTYYATEQERDDAAKDAISNYLDECWDETVTQVVAGKLTHVATQCDVINRPPDDEINEDGEDKDGNHWSEDWPYTCNYKLMPTTP